MFFIIAHSFSGECLTNITRRYTLVAGHNVHFPILPNIHREEDSMQLCVQCAKRVPMGNDAFILVGIARRQGTLLSLGVHRHLLPEGGCEGSPTLCKYLEERTEHNQKRAQAVRAAYNVLQQAIRAVREDASSRNYYLAVTHQIALLEARR